MLHVIATIEIASGKRDDYLAVFRNVVPLVRQEDGCLEYGPAIDLPTNIGAQPATRENVVTVIEKWESLPALEAHLIAPHMIEYRKLVEHLVARTTVQVFEPVAT